LRRRRPGRPPSFQCRSEALPSRGASKDPTMHPLQGGLPAAAALREAQLSLRRDPRYRDPYSWAGFVLQGHWR